MDREHAVEYLSQNHNGVLSTFRRDGMPQLSPVTLAVDDSGRVMISTREPAIKVRNLRRDPRASLCAFPEGFLGAWVQVEGAAEIVELPEAMDLLIDLYRRVKGEHPDWAEYRQAMIDQRRVVIRFAIDRAGPNVSG
jgi:PPOX class probable F420-dependent enzyme